MSELEAEIERLRAENEKLEAAGWEGPDGTIWSSDDIPNLVRRNISLRAENERLEGILSKLQRIAAGKQEAKP